MYTVNIFSDVTQIIGGIEVAGGVETTYSFATMADAMAFSDAAQSAGFNYLYTTGNTIKWSNVIGGGSYGMSAVGETGVVAGNGSVAITQAGLEADAGLGLNAGGLTYGASALQLAGAMAVGAGIGLKSYHDHPEFWTDLSNGLADGLGGSEVLPVIIRAASNGGPDPMTWPESYIREADANKILDNLYNLTKMNPKAELVPYETGTDKLLTFDIDSEAVNSAISEAYSLNTTIQAAPPASGAEAFNTAHTAFTSSYGEAPNYMDVAAQVYEYYGQPSTGVNITMGYVAQPAYSQVIDRTDPLGYASPRTTNVTGHFLQLSGIWDRAGGNFRTLNTSTTSSHQLVGGLYRTPASNNAQVGGLYTEIDVNPAVIYDNQTKKAEERSAFWTVFSDWYDKSFEVPHFNPETGEEEKERWIPLTIPQILPDTVLQPGAQPQTDTQTGEQDDPDPVVEPVLKILTKYLPWFQVPSLPEGDTPEPTPPTPAFDSTSGSGLWAIYNPTKAEITALGQYLWSSNIVDIIEKFFKNSPLEAIISLHMIYCTPTTGAAQHIILGYLDSGVSADIVTNQYETIDCGTVTISEHFGDARDYVNTTIDIMLPFIGIRQLNTADIVGSTINLKYTCDVLTGVCLAQIFVTKSGVTQCLYQYEGNCSVQIPLTAADRSRLVSGLTSSLASAVAGGAAGGPVGAIGGAVMGAVSGLSHSATLQRTGGLSGNSGAMGIKTPYIIITRKMANQLDDYYNKMGAAASYTARLGDLNGFTKVRSVQVDTLSCSSYEKEQIESYLTSGVII